MRLQWGRAAVTDRLSGRLGITGAGSSALIPEPRPRRENLSRRENGSFPGEAGNDFLIVKCGRGVLAVVIGRGIWPSLNSLCSSVPSCSKDFFFGPRVRMQFQDLEQEVAESAEKNVEASLSERRSTANCPTLGRDNLSHFRGFCPNVLESAPPIQRPKRLGARTGSEAREGRGDEESKFGLTRAKSRGAAC
jgi:hypothetical protein